MQKGFLIYMADIKLFSIGEIVKELESTSIMFEKDLQTIIESSMVDFFGVTFIKSEYSITNGRIDSLGIDENYSPVIFECKRSMSENVINQGLFYLDWLLDHKADYKLLVMDTLGIETANKIDWSLPCVICIASDFTKFDEHAVNQMQKNIRLVRYKKFGSELLLFEQINAPNIKPIVDVDETSGISSKDTQIQKTFMYQFDNANIEIKNLYKTIKEYILSLGDDVTENILKLYVAFKKVKNIACMQIQQSRIIIDLNIKNMDKVKLEKDFTRDVTNIGHYGTGNLQVFIKDIADLERAKELLNKAYNEG